MDMGLHSFGAVVFLTFDTDTIQALFQKEGKTDSLSDSFIISTAKGTKTVSANAQYHVGILSFSRAFDEGLYNNFVIKSGVTKENQKFS